MNDEDGVIIGCRPYGKSLIRLFFYCFQITMLYFSVLSCNVHRQWEIRLYSHDTDIVKLFTFNPLHGNQEIVIFHLTLYFISICIYLCFNQCATVI